MHSFPRASSFWRGVLHIITVIDGFDLLGSHDLHGLLGHLERRKEKEASGNCENWREMKLMASPSHQSKCCPRL